MITVLVYKGDPGWLGFSVRGHSGYAEAGSDIVCAAVSALTQTAVMGLVHFLGAKPEVQSEKGRLFCRLPRGLRQEESREAGIIVETMRLGLQECARGYPGNVRVATVHRSRGSRPLSRFPEYFKRILEPL